MPSRTQAFSLTELLAVLAVVAVVLALAAPSLADMRREMQVRATSHELATTLAQARMMAIARAIPFSLCAADGSGGCRSDGNWDEGWLLYPDPRNAGGARPGPASLHSRPPPGVRVRSHASRSGVRFLPDGRTPGSNLTLLICAGERRPRGSRIILSNTGRARFERVASHETDCPPS